MESQKYSNYQAFKNSQEQKKSPTALIIIIIILAIAIGVLGYMYYTFKQEAAKVQQELEMQKVELEDELLDLSVRYDSLKTDNDSMNIKLEQEQTKINRLLSLRASNLEKIKIYKKELKTLREIMKSYITQIDSLNTLNKQLTAENIIVKNEYTKVKSKNIELSEKNVNLSSTVALAQIMKADNIQISGINERSKPVKKARKVDKIKICFTLLENKVVETGTKDVFIRIITQDNYVLVNSENNLFTVEDEQIVFTETRQIQYDNLDIDMCIYWKNNGDLASGNYEIFIYTDGHEIGKSNLLLK